MKGVLMQGTGQERKTELLLPVWVVLFVLGIIVVGVGRFFGWRDNPTHIWHEWAPLFVVVLAVFVCIFGYFRFAKGNEAQDSAKKWTGIGFIVLGLAMLGVSFAIRYIGPLVVG
ncbi:MAG: hypothetical protein LBC23_01685 [Coriobacteriales bacterium]|jgi:fucose 4-O-acetylase-like acetyltransferase|nr:hypothetical protein [Coriobacteriales bacterium]